MWQPTRILLRKAPHGCRPVPEGLLQAWGLLGGEPGGGWPKARMLLFSTQEEHYRPPLVPQSLQLACGVSSLGLGVPQRPFHQILTHGVTVLPKMKGGTGDREMAQQSKALAALPEDLGSVTSTYMGAHNLSNALFWPLWALHTCDTQTYMQAKQSYTYKYEKTEVYRYEGYVKVMKLVRTRVDFTSRHFYHPLFSTTA